MRCERRRVVWVSAEALCGLHQALPEGLQQTADYMHGIGADEGHLIIFDKDMTKKPSEKIYRKTEKQEGSTITVWGT